MQNPVLKLTVATVLAAACATSAFAQSSDARDANQQQRIENGLQSGQLNTREAGRLERGEARIDRLEAGARRDGTVTPAEQARIGAAQNRESAAIYRQKHDAQVGDPGSASSRRLQRDVARSENQEARIARGERTGQLSAREAGALERGQARVDRATARAAADGHVGPREQARVQARENNQSARIYRKKHNGVGA